MIRCTLGTAAVSGSGTTHTAAVPGSDTTHTQQARHNNTAFPDAMASAGQGPSEMEHAAAEAMAAEMAAGAGITEEEVEDLDAKQATPKGFLGACHLLTPYALMPSCLLFFSHHSPLGPSFPLVASYTTS